MLEKLTIQDFTKHLNHTFQIQVAAGASKATSQSLNMELVEASLLGETPKDDDQRQAFSIIFRGPEDQLLPQQIYRVIHDELGQLDMFLVPLGPDNGGVLYEAVFN